MSDEEIKNKILTILDQHRVLTIATWRPDGWPQATTVVYANEGLTIYFVCDPASQKATNLARDDRVSLTVDHDTPDVTEITGLSMAARAQAVVNLAEVSKALHMLRLKYPLLPVPMPEDVRDLPSNADNNLGNRLFKSFRPYRFGHLLIAMRW